MSNHDNFLSAPQLGITESELDAFTRVLRRFETNPPECRRLLANDALPPSFSRVKFFNMGSTIAKADHECGAVACLFGWAHHLAPDLPDLQDHGDELSLPLARLCGFSPEAVDWAATAPQAAATLRHFLETGAVDWP